jgi:lipopolysaccharide export system permease protein
VKILDRHVLREFLGYLGLALAGFIVLFIVVDVFEKIDVFLDHRAPPALIAQFYLYRAPEVVVQVLPVALLLATFLSFGQLNKFGELTSMRTAGLSFLRITTPALIAAFLCSLASLVFGEWVVPYANQQRDDIYKARIQGIQRATVNERTDLTYLGAGGQIYYMRLYLVNEERMHEVVLQEFAKGEIKRRIDAAEAHWDGRQWVFVSGMEREFPDGNEVAVPFDEMPVPELREKPDDFAKENRNPDEMNFFELRTYIARMRASGARVANYLVDLHVKLAFPLINFIVVMIGAPLATRLRLQSAALGFGISVAV